ncbi:DUF1365 domain-containing protein [Pseudooceanicola sp.]
MTGHSWHGRKGAVENAFRYGVDYVLIDAESAADGPSLFARNARAFAAVQDRDHGGPPGRGSGPAWLREVLADHDLPAPARIRLLTQPRLLGFVFNPVSFWLCEDDRGDLRCVVAEVTNTFGDRHAYLCHRDDHAPITREDELTARKLMHVSPFQPVEGRYRFRFDIQPDRIGIRIDYDREGGGVIATLTGRLAPLTNRGLLAAFLRRPFGSLRVLALIHWQALKLWRKGAGYRRRPAAPSQTVSR